MSKPNAKVVLLIGKLLEADPWTQYAILEEGEAGIRIRAHHGDP
jgi:hypothetical protein